MAFFPGFTGAAELVFKKYLGTADTKPGSSYTVESAGSARQKVIPSLQIYTQAIPATAPTDLVPDGTFPAGNGTRYYSTAYPYIVRYQSIKLKAIQPGFTFAYTAAVTNNVTNPALNILSSAIPYNYDSVTSTYDVFVNKSVGQGSAPIFPNDGTLPWVFDGDAGYLTFFGTTGFPTDDSQNPVISFWRYEGTFGLGSESGGGTGYTGAQGAIGPQGTLGTTGATGPQGTLGPTGSTGAQGAAGQASLTGSTGSQGFQGFTGAQGAAGHACETGATGSQGFQGFQGFTGAQGAAGHACETGATGSQGLQGAQGQIGATGTQGATGPTGSQGVAGVQGATGATGAQGLAGSAVNTGATGTQGFQGATGPTGAQGVQGPTGAQGVQGIAGSATTTGATGSTGAQGVDGLRGIQGIQGAQGIDGETGAQGDQGSTGYTGVQGSPGEASVTGATGPQGPVGDQGSTGYTGAQGRPGEATVTGATGPQGPVGAQGATGETGSTGPTGAQGIQGPTGFTGITGAQGLAGSAVNTGATGTQGSVGAQGAVGAQGVAGTASGTGATGVTGTTGATGAQGLAGSAVNTGATGTQGPVGAQGDVGAGVTGPTGSGGNAVYNDAFFASNMFSSPPTIVYETFTSRSTEIFLPWQYPSQINAAFTTYWLPAIVNVTAIVSTNAYARTQSTILGNVSSVGYIYQHNNDVPVTGIVLSKVAGTNGIQGRLFPDGSTRSSFVFYDINLGNMTNLARNQIIMWYGNYQVGSNVAVSTFNVFVNPGPPSAPQNLAAGSITATTLNLSYTAPLSNDINDQYTTATITNYYLSGTGTTNGRRYGTAIVDTTTSNFNNGINLNSTLTVYPDSVYTLSAYARNSAGLNGASTSITSVNTLAMTPLANLSGSLSFPARYYGNGTVINISTNTTVTNLLSTNIDWSSSNFTVPIHTSNSRGAATANLMSLSTFVSGAATLTGPVTNYSGFPGTTPATQAQSNVELSTTRVFDNYSLTQQQGFYLNTSTVLTLKTGLFTPSPVQYGISTLAYYSSVVGFQGSANFSFFYDNIPANPTISTLQFSFNGTPSSYQVSGVNVLYATPQFSITTLVSSMGTFFYSSPLLRLSNTVGATTNVTTETTLTNVKVGSNVNSFSNIIGISSFVTSASITAQTIASTITMRGVANNPRGTSAAVSATNINSIIDGPSYTLVSTTLPGSIQVLANNVSTLGYRVWSAPVQANFVPYFTTNASTVTYSQIQYNNNWDISQISSSTSLVGGALDPSTEVQVFNGAFRSKGTQTLGYLDYRNFYYTNTLLNGVNYSGIAGTDYRYATYVWYAASNTVSLYNKLTFTLNNTTPTPTITGGSAVLGGTKILVYYRIENSNSLFADNNTFPTTCWIDGNGLGSTSIQASGTNFFQYPSNNGTLAGIDGVNGGVLNSGGNTSFNVIIPGTFLASNATVVRIYCRVGLPMNTDFSFTSISALLRT